MGNKLWQQNDEELKLFFSFLFFLVSFKFVLDHYASYTILLYIYIYSLARHEADCLKQAYQSTQRESLAKDDGTERNQVRPPTSYKLVCTKHFSMIFQAFHLNNYARFKTSG